MQVNEFPLDLRENYQTVTVARSQSVHISVSHLTGMRFSTNHSIMQQHAHVIHIRMTQNKICVLDEFNLDKIKDSDIVITSKVHTLHLIGYNSWQLSFHGLNIVLCKVTVRHNHCTVANKTDYKVFTVDHDPGRFPKNHDLIHQLSVAQVKDGNCSENYSLSVDIWQSFHGVGIVQHFRWSKITVIRWDMIPTIYGFRVVVGMTCEASCARACPFSFGFHSSIQRQYIFFPSALMDSMNFDGLLNGSWKHADAYCRSRGKSLPTVTTINSQDITSVLGYWRTELLLKLKLKLSFYTGLYKDKKVISPGIILMFTPIRYAMFLCYLFDVKFVLLFVVVQALLEIYINIMIKQGCNKH